MADYSADSQGDESPHPYAGTGCSGSSTDARTRHPYGDRCAARRPALDGTRARAEADSGGDWDWLAAQRGSDDVVFLKPDGKIVIGGTSQLLTEFPPPPQAILLRYNTDGSLDTGFGNGGKVLLAPPFSNITALALQTDGKILTNVGSPFVRVLPNGAIAPSQVPGTIMETAHTGPGTFQPDGRYVLTGSV